MGESTAAWSLDNPLWNVGLLPSCPDKIQNESFIAIEHVHG